MYQSCRICIYKSQVGGICFCGARLGVQGVCMCVCVRGACNLNIGDDLSGVLSSAPTIDALCTHGLRLEAADENRIC